MSSGVCVVLMTAPNAEKAGELAHALVSEKLAACVNVMPGVRSVYRWEGAVQDESEVLLLAKTTADRFAALHQRVLALHPYDVPEVIQVNVEQGHLPYLDWVRESTL